MKKILFIMILATTFIPGPQTGASIGEMNGPNEVKAQIMVDHVSNYILDNETKLTPGKIIKEEKTKKSHISRQRIVKVKENMSSEKRDRLFGLLLLAHGGQR